ncbi:TM2 domain-containing membrane protein YozV [Prauserella sediminis]|uniref:TM2 domain-containing membrane protein YozV n=1 Tax=Prauserella sediminis TaxID=577680 RepID=A0A839XQ19_9PSEU|nr:DUF1707 domain-containing protein [Prauserella sediminis]MBB3665330.1 TM2 domain-containing membrane protein YozV [Prauserella sediminis]
MTQDPNELRVGHTEREEASRVLADHFSSGRLSMDEYEDRVAAAAAARTRADLSGLFDDLPAPHPTFLRPPQASLPPTTHHPGSVPTAGRTADVLPPSDKSRIAAGVLQILLPFGIGRFYTGHTGLALAQLFVTLLTLGLGAIWPFIDGIVLLAKGGVDGNGRRLRD